MQEITKYVWNKHVFLKHKVEQKEIKEDLNHRTGDPKLKMKIYN